MYFGRSCRSVTSPFSSTYARRDDPSWRTTGADGDLEAVGTQDLDEPDAELTASSPHPDVEGMKFLDREVNELLSDLEG
jgi:hypothetical protein